MATVLVVDDNPADRALLRALLTYRSHTVREAATGDEALATARSVVPDLVVTDLLMPGIDGYELARSIRRDPDLVGTRVVFCTAATVDPRFRELAARCGVTGVVPKPTEPEATLAIIDEALARVPGSLASTAVEGFDRDHLTILTEALSRKVDELRRANDGLRRSEARFRTLLDLAPDAILGVDRAGRITLANALAEAVFRYRRDELIGQPIEMLLPEDSRPRHPEHRARYLGSPSLRPMGLGLDLAARRKDGSLFPVAVSLSTIDTDDGPVVLAAVDDITARVEAERVRIQLEARLQQSERLESVGQLAGGIAHDFNNLLAVIINYAGFASSAVEADAGVYADLHHIRRAADRAAELTRQLLLFSRLEHSTPQAVDLGEVVDGLTTLLRRTIEENIDLEVDLEPNLPLLLVDRSKLEQVVLNLVVNARDALPSGGSITVSAVAADAESIDDPHGPYVRIAVADTGVGMAPQVAARAFEPFYSTKPRGQGTGLGLATVYGVVKEAGGDVIIDSEVDRGTTISILLPVAVDAVLAVDKPSERIAPGGHGRILVVEDDEEVREVTRRILTDHAYDVVTAGTPSEAIDVAGRGSPAPDLVVTDIVMPEMSGPDLVVQLRQPWPGVPALYMSGYTGSASGGVVTDATPLLRKPFDEAMLLHQVRQILEASPAG